MQSVDMTNPALLKRRTVLGAGLGTLAMGHAAQALAQGVRWVVVTRGGEGALAWNARGRVQAACESVAVIDTVGAGDTFQAALLSWLAEHQALNAHALSQLGLEALAQALRFASQAAAITCSRRGADMPYRAELLPRA